MTVGIGLFSVITSFTADWFRRPRRRRFAKAAVSLTQSDESVASHVETLRDLIAEHEKYYNESMAAIRKQLAILERLQ